MCIGIAPSQRTPWPHPFIAREGWPYLAGTLLVAIAVTWFAGGLWASPLWITTLFVLQFFRDPPRSAPTEADAVLSPADGRIVKVETTRDPWLERDAIKISVFMNVFNVHSNRAPVDGLVKQRWYSPGKFVNADLDKASTENERNAFWFQTRAGQDITCVQVAGLIARRILWYVEPGARVARGERYGFIRFGSRVDVYLPLGSHPRVALGDRVSAGETILARIPG